MKITTFLYCLNSINNTTPTETHITADGILPMIKADFIPTTFSFSVILGVTGLDMSKDHTITITFNDPNNKPLIESNDFNMPKDDKVNGLPIGAQGFMLSMDFRNTKLEQEGMYYTNIIIDGENLGNYEIYVARKKQD